MSEKSDLLSKTRPLADPLRVIAIVGFVNTFVIAIVGVATGHVWNGLALACLSLGTSLLIAPSGKPNAIYLRAFRTDKSTVRLRAEIAAILGPDFRLSGVLPPRKRASVFTRFLLPGLVGLRYAGSKFMELEAGEDWMARLWKTLQTTRLVLMDIRDVTPYIQQEVRMTLQTVGASRSVFVVGQERTDREWRQLLEEFVGPEGDSSPLQMLDASPERVCSRQLESDLQRIVKQLPAGVPGELESGRLFILDHSSEELLKKGRLPFMTTVAAVAALLLSVSVGALRSLMAEGVLLFIAIAGLGLVMVLLITAIFRGALRARRLKRAGHRQAAARAWSMLLLVILLLLATPVFIVVQFAKAAEALKKSANEISAIQSLRVLNEAEVEYSAIYPEIGFVCKLSQLGGNAASAAPSPEAAQLIDPNLASGKKFGYTFAISNCTKTTVNGQIVYTGYEITAVPNIVGETRERGFCTDEKMDIRSDPKGGISCTERLR